MLSKNFGRVLREVREEKQISQEKLAEYANLDRTYISLLERGLRQPSLTTLFSLAYALSISPSDFIKKVENLPYTPKDTDSASSA
jgi:transcriptional regulator with XRE-family HTH domain